MTPARSKHTADSSDQQGSPPWWKNGWVFGLLILGLLHLTGTAVHVQAAFQRVVLMTGLFHPDLVPEPERVRADLEFRLSDEGGVVFSPADHVGEVQFINFWATWCAPCLAEMPAIARLKGAYGDRVRFVLVSMDADFETAVAFMRHHEYGLGPSRPQSPIPTTMTNGVIPTTVVVDRAGRMAVYETGMADYDSKRFRAVLDRLLSENVAVPAGLGQRPFRR